MFSVTEVTTPKGLVQYREERFTGFRCRISPDRSKRHVLQPMTPPQEIGDCPFCPDRVFSVTPSFPDGRRIIHGESITFPNMFPFGQGHVVTVITREHRVNTFSRQQIADALAGQVEALQQYDGYPSINMNFLPSAGASLIHPHMQGLSETRPSLVMERYLQAGQQFQQCSGGSNYWEAVREEEKVSGRYLFGDEILWSAHAVPCGEREVRGILPVGSLNETGPYIDLLAHGILEVLAFYRNLGTYAFNMSIFFDKPDENSGFHAFCSLISRINPNSSSMSDSAFMERLHLEPVIMTLPEEMGLLYKREKK
ncbi:galactose-1-phosphate uridylyltransferase [Methanoregula sp.]|uniref:galactose-1-phosphate uridylyltransferase n=1 Tax=Methanoregula sp. TaxID=2052170 RepID=UPI00237212F7|nr:galactose-1-phosphate uridylyltransferase [Methanoregula sp.]MDD1687781.1 galactose-1-phosphate uridylyltransferase [Methanoregula sp.]